MLSVGVFIERDQVSIRVEYGELFGSPWLGFEGSLWVNNGMSLALVVQELDPSHLHPATRGFRDVPICAGPEVNLNRPIGNDAIAALSHMDFHEAQLEGEELCTSLDIK